MPGDDLSARLRAVERALTDGDEIPDLSAAANAERRLDALEAEMEALAERLDALDATVQSLHGYVGELEHVNDRVERRADAARAAVERLEGRRTPPQASRDQCEPTSATTDSASTDAAPADSTRTDAAPSHRTGDDETKRGGATQYSDEERQWNCEARRGDGTKDDAESLLGRVRDAL